jgi:hypothetical protein
LKFEVKDDGIGYFLREREVEGDNECVRPRRLRLRLRLRLSLGCFVS